MAFIQAKGRVLKDALLSSIQPYCEALQSMAAHGKTKEYREKVTGAFFSIFDTVAHFNKEKGKWSFQVSLKEIAEATGYSDVMVGYYRTLWTSQDSTVTVEKPARIARDTEGTLLRDENGAILMEEAEPETIAVKDQLLEMDVAELARAIRSEELGASRPVLSQRTKGENQAKRVLALTATDQADWLAGFAGLFESTGSVALLEVVTATHASATRKGKERARVVETIRPQDVGTLTVQ